MENLLHYQRSLGYADPEEPLNYSDFEERIGKVSLKHGNKYQFLLNAGQGFKKCLFSLFSLVWQTEQKPQQWRNTIIVQLQKAKGNINSFDSLRNIHTKEFIPKLFEGIVVDKSKEN